MLTLNALEAGDAAMALDIFGGTFKRRERITQAVLNQDSVRLRPCYVLTEDVLMISVK